MAKGNKLEDKVPEGKAKPSLSREQPGGLRSSMTMSIQTRLAQSMVDGRQRSEKGEQIIGLFAFGHRLKQIWLSAEANDPYADWYLVQIEEGLQRAKQLIGEKHQWIMSIMSGKEGFNINTAESNRPIEVELFFQNPYGYIGAYIIHDYDVLARMVFTAKHIGLLNSDDARIVMQEAGASIRHSFGLSMCWKFTGVTRDDLLENNLNAQRVVSQYGECPAGILSETIRAKASPIIRKKQAEIIDEATPVKVVAANESSDEMPIKAYG